MIQYTELVSGSEQFRNVIVGKHRRLSARVYYPRIVPAPDAEDSLVLDVKEIAKYPTKTALVMSANGIPRMKVVNMDPDDQRFAYLLEEVEA